MVSSITTFTVSLLSNYKLSQRSFIVIFIGLWICFNPAGASGADEITHISVIQADTGRETALQSKLQVGLVYARPGDRLVLSAGRIRKHVFDVTESKRSSLGNTIIRGTTVSGGRVLLVVDNKARIKGHFQEPDGMVQLTTDEFGVTTAWREGIDTVQKPFECEVEVPPASDWPMANQFQADESESETLLEASKWVVDQEEPKIKYARYATGDATVRILIYYDSSMSEYIARLADFLVELTNDALTNSFVPVSLELAGIKAIDIDDMTLNTDLLTAMAGGESPFETIGDDRIQYGAYLTATLRDSEDGFPEGDNAGIAYLGGEFTPNYRSVTRYTRYRPGEPFYPSYTFAHEIGHNLGANHARWQFTEEEMQDKSGFSYAYGYLVEGFKRTIMSYGKPGAWSSSRYSNPDVIIDGIQMGVPFDRPDSADVSRAFWNNGHVAGEFLNEAHAGELVSENIWIRESECGEELEEGAERGRYRWHRISVSSDSGIQVNSSHKIRRDGSAMVYRYPSDYRYASHYDCRLPDEGQNSLGTDYVESFFRYTDPATGELVESAHVFWEEDMDEDYSRVRVAHTDGGEAVGNTSLLLKEGSEHTVEFDADYGYKVTDIKSSCDGRRQDNSFIVNVTSDDCRVEATFGKGDSGTIAQDNILALLGGIQGLGEPPPAPSAEDQFVGTYHIFRPQRPGREDFIRIGDDQSLAFGYNTTYYKWELNDGNLDVYYMYQPDDPAGDFRFTLSQDADSGRIEVVDSYNTSSDWDFYGERKSTDSEANFDLYELGRDYYGEEQHVLKCFNIGRRELSFYSTSWYSDSQLPATSTNLEECRSYCPAILEDYQERDPDNWSDKVCDGDQSESEDD